MFLLSDIWLLLVVVLIDNAYGSFQIIRRYIESLTEQRAHIYIHTLQMYISYLFRTFLPHLDDDVINI